MTTTAEKTGKGKYGTRHTVVAYRIDHAVLRDAARRYLHAVYYPHPADAAETAADIERVAKAIRDDEWVALKVKDDGTLPDRDWVNPDAGRETWAVICSEGVGYVPTDYSLYELPVLFSMGGSSRYLIGQEVLWSAITDEEVDLADFIRTFGDRLEGNFSLWASRAA